MNKEMLKKIMGNMDVVKELEEYGKNKLATLMEGLLIKMMGKERCEYLRNLNTGFGKLSLEVPRTRSGNFHFNLLPPETYPKILCQRNYTKKISL